MTSVCASESLEHAEVLGAGTTPRWGPWWSSLPTRRRRAVAVAAVTVLAIASGAAGAAQLADWLGARERREVVVLTTSLGVWASSTTPPGGQVTYYLSIRNGGEVPLDVTDVRARTDHVVLRARDPLARRVAPGEVTLLPLSVLLTCAPDAGSSGDALRVQVDVRRTDGSTTSRFPVLGGTDPVLSAADTLCEVRPGLVAYELSGPVLRARAAEGGEG